MNEDINCELCNKILFTAYILEPKNKGCILCSDCFAKVLTRDLKYYSVGVISVKQE